MYLLISSFHLAEGDPPLVHPRGQSIKSHATPPPPPPRQRTVKNRTVSTSAEKPRGHCLWDLSLEKYTVTIQGLSNLQTVPEYSKVNSTSNQSAVYLYAVSLPCILCLQIQVRAGIYHGETAMCAVSTTRDCLLTECIVSWNDTLTFDIALADIPRNARLCFLVESVSDKRTTKRPATGGKGAKTGRQVQIKYCMAHLIHSTHICYFSTGSELLGLGQHFRLWLQRCLAHWALGHVHVVYHRWRYSLWRASQSTG